MTVKMFLTVVQVAIWLSVIGIGLTAVYIIMLMIDLIKRWLKK